MAFLALQNAQPRLCQLIGVIGRVAFPGAMHTDLARQDALKWRVVPALLGGGHGHIERPLLADVGSLVAPSAQLLDPGAPLIGAETLA